MTQSNKAVFDNYRNRINSVLADFTKDKPELQGLVAEAMEYSLSAGGKRVRPILVLEFCRMCGGNPELIYDIACTIEMIHTFSLIHDDLPCMDNDDFRRGKPSCHKKFPEAIALLAGDALNTLPFEVISKKALRGEIPFETAVKLIDVLSSAVGVNGMIGGQVIDMEAEKRKISLDELNTLQSLKTGALIKASCKMGCIVANRDDMCGYAEKYAEALGRAFQIVDDILDVTGTFEELGKPIGSDGQQEKSTYVTLMGIEKSECEAKVLTEKAISVLENFDNNGFLKEFTEELLVRRN